MAHEALIREWDRLAGWLGETRGDGVLGRKPLLAFTQGQRVSQLVNEANTQLTNVAQAVATGERRISEGEARIESQRLAAEAVDLLTTDSDHR